MTGRDRYTQRKLGYEYMGIRSGIDVRDAGSLHTGVVFATAFRKDKRQSSQVANRMELFRTQLPLRAEELAGGSFKLCHLLEIAIMMGFIRCSELSKRAFSLSREGRLGPASRPPRTGDAFVAAESISATWKAWTIWNLVCADDHMMSIQLGSASCHFSISFPLPY